MANRTLQRRSVLAALPAAAAAPAAASDGTVDAGPAPTSEPASVLPDHRVETRFMILPNPVLNDFEIFFVSGPREGNGNIMVQVRLNPDQARRVAQQLLAELEGWPEQVAKAQAAYGTTA